MPLQLRQACGVSEEGLDSSIQWLKLQFLEAMLLSKWHLKHLRSYYESTLLCDVIESVNFQLLCFYIHIEIMPLMHYALIFVIL